MFIIDAETYEPMEGGNEVYKKDIRPQMTIKELQEFKQLIEQSAKSGAAFTSIQIVAMFSLKKALHVNWLLITSLQIYVYINDWNLLYPRNL